MAFGTRPEVIKLAPVIRALEGRAETVLCSTGQHHDMLPPALDAFGLAPHVDLAVMTADQPLNVLFSRVIAGVDAVYLRERPDWVLVQGDTTTTLAAALAAFHRGIPVGHVEAGLRSHQLDDPFPEEGNRSLVARIARLHFAPTERARANLLKEAVDPARIVVTGNTIVDAIALMRDRRATPDSAVAALADPRGRLVLVTCHRREKFGKRLEGICGAVASLCRRYPDIRFVFPVHPNPNVRGPVHALLGGIANLSLLDSVSYRASLDLVARAALILTDSGGIQEEAPSFGVPVVVMREHTERPENIEAGFATLAGIDPAAIEREAVAWLDDPARAARLRTMDNPFGDGRAAERIVSSLLSGRANP